MILTYSQEFQDLKKLQRWHDVKLLKITYRQYPRHHWTTYSQKMRRLSSSLVRLCKDTKPRVLERSL